MRILLLSLSLLFSALASAQGLDTLTVRIKGMRCDECAHKVMDKVMGTTTIDDIWFNIERRTASVSYDPTVTTPDAILAPLRGTRYNPTPYADTDTIMRGMGQRMATMQTEADAARAMAALQGMVGVDSLAPHTDRHYLFIRYDANRTSKADIRRALVTAGFTPTNYYSSPKVAYATFALPAARAATLSLDSLLALDGVEDACLNAALGTLAITYFTDETTADKLDAAVKGVVLGE